MVNSNLINEINKIMERRGITMYRIAQKTGLSQSTVRLILKERKNPTLDKLVLILDKLNLQIELKEKDESKIYD